MAENPLEVIVDTQLPVHEVSEATYRSVLADCAAVMASSGLPHAIMGGLASSIYGRVRRTHDLDLFVRPDDAERALEVVSAAGYETEKSNPDWIYKATKKGLLVDVIYLGSDGAVFDAEMQKRTRLLDFNGNQLPIVAPEDLLALKLAAFREDTARQWYDCLAVLESQDLDWDYLGRRAARRPHRVLALLIYAAGEGIPVSWPVIDRLLDVARPG